MTWASVYARAALLCPALFLHTAHNMYTKRHTLPLVGRAGNVCTQSGTHCPHAPPASLSLYKWLGYAFLVVANPGLLKSVPFIPPAVRASFPCQQSMQKMHLCVGKTDKPFWLALQEPMPEACRHARFLQCLPAPHVGPQFYSFWALGKQP